MSEAASEYRSAVVLAALIRKRELSPVEVVEAALARIARVNPALNAFPFVYPEAAIEAARAAEAAVMRGDALGPLHGVPIALKDFTPTRGQSGSAWGTACKGHPDPQSRAAADDVAAGGARRFSLRHCPSTYMRRCGLG